MRQIFFAALAVILMAPVANAQYIDCTGPGGCVEQIYGMGNPAVLSAFDSPNTIRRITDRQTAPGGRIGCIAENPPREGRPTEGRGQFALREQVDCTVSEGTRCPLEIPDRSRLYGEAISSNTITTIGALGVLSASTTGLATYQGNVGFRQMNGRCVDGAGDTVLKACTVDADCDAGFAELCDPDGGGFCIQFRQAERSRDPLFDPVKVGGTKQAVQTNCWNDGQCGAGDSCQATCAISGNNCTSDAGCGGAGDSCGTRIEWDGIGKCIPTADFASGQLEQNGTGLCITDPDPGNPAQACAVDETCLDAFHFAFDACICCQSSTNTICPAVGIPDNSELTCPRSTGLPLRANAPDWIFEGGAGTIMYQDTIWVEGQQEGICFANRSRGCGFIGSEVAGARNGKCTSGDGECSFGDPIDLPLASECDDVAFGGVAGDRCDVSETGFRFVPGNPVLAPDGRPNPIKCASNTISLRAEPDRFCFIAEDLNNSTFPVGFPFTTACTTDADCNTAQNQECSPSRGVCVNTGGTFIGCALTNYGFPARPDNDCNGIDDATEGRCHPDGESACAVDADCDSAAGAGDGNCITADVCPFIGERAENAFLDSNGDGIGDECQCGDFGIRVIPPVANDGAITGIDIGGLALCANGVFPPDPVFNVILECDSAYLDADGDFAVTSLDIAGVVATVNGDTPSSSLVCGANRPCVDGSCVQ